MDWKLELESVPVSDVDRAKAFYAEKVGSNADEDHRVSDSIRFVQLTPRGSACSIVVGEGISDIEAARAELVGREVEVSEVQDYPWDRFGYFSDPDGNGWAVQQLPIRE